MSTVGVDVVSSNMYIIPNGSTPTVVAWASGGMTSFEYAEKQRHRQPNDIRVGSHIPKFLKSAFVNGGVDVLLIPKIQLLSSLVILFSYLTHHKRIIIK